MKGSSIDECVAKAEQFIKKKGICLLLFDVQYSRYVQDRQKLQEELMTMIKDINSRFDKYFPENYLATPTRLEKGFEVLLGDGAGAGISSAEVILQIVKYQQENYPHIPLYWDVARDGFDTENTEIIR